MKKYRPQDLIARIEYEKALREFKLKKNGDPTTIFDHFTEVNVPFGINDPDKKKMIAIALEKLPREYSNSFTTLSTSLRGNVDMDMFEENVGALYRVNNGKTTSKDDEGDEEVNLSGFDSKKKGKGKGKGKKNKGKKTNDDGDEDSEKCKHCGRLSHEANDCWMLEKN